MNPKVRIFSETYEDHKIDDYIALGDDGPWYGVVSVDDYLALKEWCERLHAALYYFRGPDLPCNKKFDKYDKTLNEYREFLEADDESCV